MGTDEVPTVTEVCTLLLPACIAFLSSCHIFPWDPAVVKVILEASIATWPLQVHEKEKQFRLLRRSEFVLTLDSSF